MDEDGKITKATKNATRLWHPVTHNSITVKAKATSRSTALSLARGLTAPILHFDEPEFTHEIKTIVENSVSTYKTAAEKSAANGTLYGRIFTCTPKQILSLGVKLSNEFKKNLSNFWELLKRMIRSEVPYYIRYVFNDYRKHSILCM